MRSPELVPDEGPEQCQEGLHIPRGMDNHQGAQVLPEPGRECEVILCLFPPPRLKIRWSCRLLRFRLLHFSNF